MSKLPLSLAVAALLVSTAGLAQNGEAERSAPERAAGPSLMDRARSAGRSIADKTRELVHRGEQKVENARSKDDGAERGSGAMGNRGTDTGGQSARNDESARKQRMDQAHDNWQKRQGGASSPR